MYALPATNRPLTWLRRYLLAELVSVPAALFCAWLAATLTGSTAAPAVAGTWARTSASMA